MHRRALEACHRAQRQGGGPGDFFDGVVAGVEDGENIEFQSRGQDLGTSETPADIDDRLWLDFQRLFPTGHK